VLGPVGVDGPAPTLVPGVERGEQVENLGSPNLTDYQAVRAHPQCLTHQEIEVDLPLALGVRGAGGQPDDVRVFRSTRHQVVEGERPSRRDPQ
jgi:hypothetical protein